MASLFRVCQVRESRGGAGSAPGEGEGWGPRTRPGAPAQGGRGERARPPEAPAGADGLQA